MTENITLVCPDYTSGACLERGCPGILVRPHWTGSSSNGEDLYAGSCPTGATFFRNIIPVCADKQQIAYPTTPPNFDGEALKIEPPKMELLEDCKRFCRSLYQSIRYHMKDSIHSETQAIDYILHRAKDGDQFYADCKLARRINSNRNWKRATFTTYCKERNGTSPKGNRRTAKRKATQKKIAQDLNTLKTFL